jgi:hypothetical protein
VVEVGLPAHPDEREGVIRFLPDRGDGTEASLILLLSPDFAPAPLGRNLPRFFWIHDGLCARMADAGYSRLFGEFVGSADRICCSAMI